MVSVGYVIMYNVTVRRSLANIAGKVCLWGYIQVVFIPHVPVF